MEDKKTEVQKLFGENVRLTIFEVGEKDTLVIETTEPIPKHSLLEMQKRCSDYLGINVMIIGPGMKITGIVSKKTNNENRT